MSFLFWFVLHIILFVGCYFVLSFRNHVIEKFDNLDSGVIVIICAIIPFFGILWGLCEIAIYKLGWRK